MNVSDVFLYCILVYGLYILLLMNIYALCTLHYPIIYIQIGKTIEVIALFAQLILYNASGPYIIIAPLATITNWLKEFQKWLPQCPVLLYHGTKLEREALRKTHMSKSYSTVLPTTAATGTGTVAMSVQDTKNNFLKKFPPIFPIIITSFEISMIDRPFLEQYEWKFMVLDEGHRIKNRNCRLVKELKAIPCVTRLLLTGTPIQNSLEELWSLLNFVNPSIFDDLGNNNCIYMFMCDKCIYFYV